jgi:hypothetical protein
MDFKLWLESKYEVSWIPGDPLKDLSGRPFVLYHGTGEKFRKFSLRNATQGIIWFTSDREAVLDRSVGAAGSGRIVSVNLRLENPAGWEEYEKLMLGQLKSYGYDGAILPNNHGHFDAFVFSPGQIKIISNVEVL